MEDKEEHLLRFHGTSNSKFLRVHFSLATEFPLVPVKFT